MGNDEVIETAETPASQSIKLNEAVERAKEWLISTMANEKPSNIGLEEVERRHGVWHITLGFSRPWDASRNAVAILSGDVVMRRTYKIIAVDEKTGEIISMKNRDKD